MSNRGSFCTEYIYCNKCFEKLKPILLERDKFLCSTTIPSWLDDGELPIIAGKVGSTGDSEIYEFERDFRDKIEDVIYHDILIAVIQDNGDAEFLKFKPVERGITR